MECPQVILLSLSFGLFAGISPGPLTVLIVSETIRKGFRSGMIVSFAPILTDGPVIIMGFLLIHLVSSGGYLNLFLAGISFAGSIFLFYLAIQMLFSDHSKNIHSKESPKNNISNLSDNENSYVGTYKDIYKGIFVNFLSPHPYLFWFTIGIPSMMKTSIGFCRLIFVLIFFGVIVSIKIFLTYSVSQGKKHINPVSMNWVIRSLSIAFFYFVYILVKDGISLLSKV